MKKIQAIAVILVLVMQLAIQLASVGITFASHTATVQWRKPGYDLPVDDPSYPPMPRAHDHYFWNGRTPKWIYFNVTNNGPDSLKEIKVVFQKYPNGDSMFNFTFTSQSKTGWSATPDEFGPNKRPTVLHFTTDSQYIAQGETVTFGLFMTAGPEECEHNIDVWTVDAGPTPSTNFYELYILIDTHYPHVLNTNPPDGKVFRNSTDPTVRVEARAWEDGPHLSGIKNATLRIHYVGSPPISDYIHIMHYDPVADRYYLILSQGDGLRDEYWHIWTVTVFDYAENGPASTLNTTTHGSITYLNATQFFWFIDANQPSHGAYTTDPCFLKNVQPELQKKDGVAGVGHVGGNAYAYVLTGFEPNLVVNVTFEGNGIIPIRLGAPPSNDHGGVDLNFMVPEKPRGTYRVVFTQYDPPNVPITYYANFTIIPWMQIEQPNSTDVPSGPVGTQIRVNGTGFDPLTNIEVFYRDVSSGVVYSEWTHEWSDKAFNFSWQPHLGNFPLNDPLSLITDVHGTFRLTFTVPESYGGYHPIFGQEWSPILGLLDVRSGWMNIPSTDPQPYPEKAYPEAAFFNVTTTVWTDPTTGFSDQYIKIYASGLPLPEYNSSKYDCYTIQTTIDNHNWTLALNFSESNKYWVFEKSFLLNNEFDLAWNQQLYLPFAYWYNHNDPTSPTWNGKLYWKDYEGQFRLGSQFLEVPTIESPKDYTISLYEFDRQTHVDVLSYLSKTNFKVLKDPLYVRASSGTLYFKGENVTVYAEIDLDGTATNPTDISFRLYNEDLFLMTLTAKPVADAEGLYVASFTCPQQDGNYFVKVNATKTIGGITLSGFGVTSFTASPTLDGLNAILTGINNGIATINTKLGTITLDLSDVKGNITSINGNIATITTGIGKIETDISTINGKLVRLDALSTNIATIQTDLGTFKTTLDSLNAEITSVGADTVIIKTTLGDVQGKITDIQGKTVDIQTSIGQVSTTADSIKTQNGLQPTGIALSLIAALAAIIVAILIFRKLYK